MGCTQEGGHVRGMAPAPPQATRHALVCTPRFPVAAQSPPTAVLLWCWLQQDSSSVAYLYTAPISPHPCGCVRAAWVHGTAQPEVRHLGHHTAAPLLHLDLILLLLLLLPAALALALRWATAIRSRGIIRQIADAVQGTPAVAVGRGCGCGLAYVFGGRLGCAGRG